MIRFLWHKYKKIFIILIAIGLLIVLCHEFINTIQGYIEIILHELEAIADKIGMGWVILLISIIGWVLNFFGVPTYFPIMIVTWLLQDWRAGFVFALVYECICFSSQLFLSRFVIGSKITKKYSDSTLYIWINEHLDSLGYILFVVLRYMPAVAYEVQNYVLGVSTLKWRKFAFYSMLVSIPANLMITNIAVNATILTPSLFAMTFLFAVGFNIILFFVVMILAMLFDKNKSIEVRRVLNQGKEMIRNWWKKFTIEKENYLYEQELAKK